MGADPGGRAVIEVEGERTMLGVGDHLFIASGAEHRVVFTDPQAPTIWLAVHIGEGA